MNIKLLNRLLAKYPTSSSGNLNTFLITHFSNNIVLCFYPALRISAVYTVSPITNKRF